MTPAYRVQDAAGRGPWRPGFSHTWIDGTAPADRHAETLADLLPAAAICALPDSMVYGCACRTLADLMRWFTPIERSRLAACGYWPVKVQADCIVAESPYQMLIGRRRPFADGASRYRWQP